MRPPVDFGRSSRDSDRYLKLMIFIGIVRGTTDDITEINWVDFDVVRPCWISNVDHGRQRKERNKGWRIWHQFSTQMYQNQANGLHNSIAGRTVISLASIGRQTVISREHLKLLNFALFHKKLKIKSLRLPFHFSIKSQYLGDI